MNSKCLDAEKARRYEEAWYGDANEPDLSGFTHVSAEAAKILSECNKDLELDGLRDIDPEVAKLLVGSTRYLSLDGLTSLNAGVALAFAGFEGSLSLNGLPEIDDSVADLLRSHIGDLRLSRLSHINTCVANALSQHQGPLWLNGLTLISDEVADCFSEFKFDLDLGNVKSISGTAALSLAGVNGALNLSGLKSLSIEAARGLAAHQGPLSLDGVESIATEAALEIAKHRGELSIGLVAPAIEAAAALSKHEYELNLPNVRDLTPEVAVAFAPHSGHLRLSGVTNLTAEVVMPFAQHGTNIHFAGVESLDVPTAIAFSRHIGVLSLLGLRHLSAEVAEQLVRHPGELRVFPDAIQGLAGAILTQLPNEIRFHSSRLDTLDLRFLAPTLSHTHAASRQMAANQFCRRYFQVGAREALENLRQATDDTDPQVRLKACEAVLLLESDNSRAWNQILEFVRQSNRSLRLQAIDSIGNLGRGGIPAVETLLESLDASDLELSRRVLHALITLNPPAEKVIPALIELLAAIDDYDFDSELKESIALWGREAATVIARRWGEERNEQTFHSLFQVLRRIAWLPDILAESVLGRLDAEALSGQSLIVRLFAHDHRELVFGWFDDPASVLPKAIGHSHEKVREMAVRALQWLSNIDDERKLHLLEPAINDASSDVQQQVAWRLRELSHSKSVRVAKRARELYQQYPDSEYDDNYSLRRQSIEERIAAIRESSPDIDRLVKEAFEFQQHNHDNNLSLQNCEILVRLSPFSPRIQEAAKAWATSPDRRERSWAASILPRIEPESPLVSRWLESDSAESYQWPPDETSCAVHALMKVRSAASLQLDRLARLMQHRNSVDCARAILSIAPHDQRHLPTIIQEMCGCYCYEMKDREFAWGPSLESLRQVWPWDYLRIILDIAELHPAIAQGTLLEIIDSNTSHTNLIAVVNASRCWLELGHDQQAIARALLPLLSARAASKTEFFAVIELLSRLGPHASCAVPELVDLAGINRWLPLLTYIIETFAAIGPLALEAVPILIESLDREFPEAGDDEWRYDLSIVELRESAANALLSILEVDRALLSEMKRIMRNDYVRDQFCAAIHAAESDSRAQTLRDFCHRFKKR